MRHAVSFILKILCILYDYPGDCEWPAFLPLLFRDKDEQDSDVQDLVMSFSGLEEKVLSHYTIAKV